MKIGIGVALMLGIALSLGWEFGLTPCLSKREAWEGTVVEKFRVHSWWLEPVAYFTQSPPQRFTYYWKVDCTDGQIRTIMVPGATWGDARTGYRAIKSPGHRWPALVIPHVQESTGLQDDILIIGNWNP